MLLAKKLRNISSEFSVVVAVPRGGVVVGFEISTFFRTPLRLIVSRKIGHPNRSEYAIAAVAEDGHIVKNSILVDSVDASWYKQELLVQRHESKRRRELYRASCDLQTIQNASVVLVDDGVATGLTLRSALGELFHKKPKNIVVAIPIIPHDCVSDIEQKGVKVIALEIPKHNEYMGSVASYYRNFPQVTDSEVIELLRESHRLEVNQYVLS